MTVIVSEYGFREETADISGVSVHCVIKDADAADVSAPDVLVFIHGTASSSVIFFDVMKKLPRNQKCVAIDLPNFGISGRINLDKYPTNQELCACYSDIIGHTLQKLGIVERTILVAHSLGGFLSIYVADRFPIKKLVLLNPAGILPTLGEYGYYWGVFFKAGLPSSLFHLPLVSRELLAYMWRSCAPTTTTTTTTEFWISIFANPDNDGHRVLQRLITIYPFYSYWNTPAIMTLLDVYKKVPTHICFGEDDTIIPYHIGDFLSRLTRGEIIIHKIHNANHNPCENIERILEIMGSVNNDIECGYVKTPRHRHQHRRRCDELCRGYSYHSLQKTQDSFESIYDYLLKHTTYCPPHSASPP
jgi:pimeloyl-ACP methyl ester carboxylesterase